MSSPEVQRGLLANCVASRVQTLDDPSHRKLIWWLQQRLWQPGGLDQLAGEIIARWPERFATPSMAALGFGVGRIYSAKEVMRVRREIVVGPGFPLKNEEQDEWDLMSLSHQDYDITWQERARRRNERAAKLRASRSRPTSYPASAFADACIDHAKENLGRFLFEELCLNPAVKLNDHTLWYLPRLAETLAEMYAANATAALASAPVTQIGLDVYDTLDYALTERCLVVIDGLARMGKTFSVKQWCQAHAGEARYVQVPSSSDEISFYRAICEALGLGSGRAYKANDLRAKIESVLQVGDLALCLDEGWALWPQRNVRNAIPHRINWLLTQLVNMGVPVAIVTTPQFTKSQEALVRHGGWSSEQLIGRISHYERLAESLSKEDLEDVARHWLPNGDEKAIRLLVKYAETSEKYLQGIESLARRSRFLARKAGRIEPTFRDVGDALAEGVIPSDSAIATALAGAQNEGRRRKGTRPFAQPAQPSFNADARPLPTPLLRGTQPINASVPTTPARDSGESLLSH